MQILNEQNKLKKIGLLYLTILTVFFVLCEISVFFESSGLYLGDVKLVSNHLDIPGRVIPGIVFFILIQVMLHLSLIVFVWWLTRLICSTGKVTFISTDQLCIGLWFVVVINIVLANCFLYPNSKFSGWMFFLKNPFLLKICLAIFSFPLCLAGCLALYGIYRIISQKIKITLVTTMAALFILIATIGIRQSVVPVDAATSQLPNIILIGVDSLRPDFLSYFGYKKLSPHLDYFLKGATVFTDAYSVLARTYPSWVSILTGEYPKKTGVRTNLENQTRLNTTEMLPAILQQQGYQTVFATDETRFSNIDNHFGFDQVITPPIGFNDFLLGTLNDFPLSNLLLNTRVGKYIFPYSYGNRAVYTTYNPDSFLQLVAPVLSQPRTKPMFLTIHFCLPHYPYGWSHLPLGKISLHHYQAAVVRADRQLGDFMALLKKNRLLEHSVVIVLSDHGEAVEMAGDRVTEAQFFIAGKDNTQNTIPHFFPPSSAHETINQSGGHGTDILSLSQNHTVLAFRTFGMESNQKNSVTGLVTLMDIKPTLLELLHIQTENGSGHSLLGVVFGKTKQVPLQDHVFFESDFSPEAIRSVHPETRKVLFEGIDYFQIDPKTARIVVKNSMLHLIISSKQYANRHGNWMLALYPQNKHQMMPVLVNLKTKQWTNDLRTVFAKQSPAALMLAQLKLFYGDDITEVMNSIHHRSS